MFWRALLTWIVRLFGGNIRPGRPILRTIIGDRSFFKRGRWSLGEIDENAFGRDPLDPALEVVVEELRRRAAGELLEWLGGGDVPPARLFARTNYHRSPVVAVEELVRDDLGCDIVALKRNEPGAKDSLRERVDCLLRLRIGHTIDEVQSTPEPIMTRLFELLREGRISEVDALDEVWSLKSEAEKALESALEVWRLIPHDTSRLAARLTQLKGFSAYETLAMTVAQARDLHARVFSLLDSVRPLDSV